MRRLAAGLLVSFAVGSVWAQVPEPSSRSIGGLIVDARDGHPLRRARLTVSSVGTEPTTIFADEAGRFLLDDAGLAERRIKVGKAGYTTENAVVPAGVTPVTLRVALTRSAAIEGSVRNTFGAPVDNMEVHARLIALDPASSGATPVVQSRANPFGEYRISGLPPGTYDLTAVSRPPRPTSAEVSSEARRITLVAGDELRADFAIDAASETCPRVSVEQVERSGTAVIQGRVVAATGEPLACAWVRITRPAAIASVQTDPRGWYAIEGLPIGTYVLAAQRTEYMTLMSGQRHPDDAPVPIVIDDKTRSVRADFLLPRRPVITGTVRDEFGEPVEGIGVRAAQMMLSGGRVSTITTQLLEAISDDRGRYRAMGLTPGVYHVAATGGIVSAGAGQRARMYPAIFHPGSLSFDDAQRVAVDVGHDVHGIDIQLVPAFSATVSGTALDAAGQPVSSAVRLSKSARSVALIRPLTAPVDAAGRFVFRGVPPGEYIATASGATRQFGAQHVTVTDEDPPPLRLRAYEGATITGRVMIDGVQAPDETGITVTAHPADPDLAPDGPPAASALQNGVFRLAGVMSPSRLSVYAPRCESCYVKSAFVSGTDAAHHPFDFRSNGGRPADIEIEVSSAGAVIEGRVRGNRVGAASMGVVVFSGDRELRMASSQYVRRAVPSIADGSFRVAGLPPGPYFIAAVGASFVNRFGNPAFAFEDPEGLDQLAPRARLITVTERGRLTLSLDPLP